jgi:hypothetical protein
MMIVGFKQLRGHREIALRHRQNSFLDFYWNSQSGKDLKKIQIVFLCVELQCQHSGCGQHRRTGRPSYLHRPFSVGIPPKVQINRNVTFFK